MRIAAPALLVALASAAGAQTVHLEPVSTGAMKKMGGYMPQRLELSADKPATVKKAPDDLAAPLYGVLPMGPQDAAEGRPVYHVVVDEPEGKPARLFVDANGNGDLTDDPAAEWAGKASAGADGKEYTMYSGGTSVQLGAAAKPFPAHLGMYRFDKNDPSRAALKNTILYYSDYAREGEIELGGKKYAAFLTDGMCTGDFRGKDGDKSGVSIFIDVNGNGTFDNRGEKFDVRQAFNIGGTTYEVAGLTPSGDEFRIVKSEKTAEAIPTPPDHSVGKPITAFKATKMDGKDVAFPGDYKGKIVLLDFWATWCGPCMKEVPGLAAAYEKYHPQGFEVLGISLDQADKADKVKEVTEKNHMAWPQVYDGKFWKAAVADKYAIDSIPATFLVDGDTGIVLARGGDLRGEKLAETIEKALAKKKGPS